MKARLVEHLEKSMVEKHACEFSLWERMSSESWGGIPIDWVRWIKLFWPCCFLCMCRSTISCGLGCIKISAYNETVRKTANDLERVYRYELRSSDVDWAESNIVLGSLRFGCKYSWGWTGWILHSFAHAAIRCVFGLSFIHSFVMYKYNGAGQLWVGFLSMLGFITPVSSSVHSSFATHMWICVLANLIK